MSLSWAAPQGSATGPRPTPRALNTWGGLFYLLRDIAFFAGIDRPTGPMSLYIEVWALGPPALVKAINAASEAMHTDTLIDAAQDLVTLRADLIGQHLAQSPISAEGVQRRVRSILAKATGTAEPSTP